MRTTHFMIVLVLLVLALPASPAQAGGVVSLQRNGPDGCAGGWRHGDVQLQRHDHPDVHPRDRG